ncbi:MAG: hypothetical protein VYA34_05420 [Myxococcota bacterium]|nr:hypothetical protein [Myxococcota bacterium]
MNAARRDEILINEISRAFTRTVAETNGINIVDTLELLCKAPEVKNSLKVINLVSEFRQLILEYQFGTVSIETLLEHQVSTAIESFFSGFPLKYHEEHIHLTGSLTADFLFEGFQDVLSGEHGEAYQQRIDDIFGPQEITSAQELDQLIRLRDDDLFDRYLRVLELPAMVLKDGEAHRKAAYHMARTLYTHYNVGNLKLKFTFARVAADPRIKVTPSREVVQGLFEGFNSFKQEVGDFDFSLSPSFRKEASYFDKSRFGSKKEAFDQSVTDLLALIDEHPELAANLNEVDTVGNERNLFRKDHFRDMQPGFRRLQRRGFQIRSHHGEVWKTLSKGIQAVDNAMNIWDIDNLEHGLSLGINPNYYFHSLYQRVSDNNEKSIALTEGTRDYDEISDMVWKHDSEVPELLIQGKPLTVSQQTAFSKAKFRTALEIERYQHDVLNRMIHKNISLVALPSSNKKLTENFVDYKDHPFSWWEKKGLRLGVGTDNYVTLNTHFIREMLILLYTDSENLKITKLLMMTTKENRRPMLSDLLWHMVLRDSD